MNHQDSSVLRDLLQPEAIQDQQQLPPGLASIMNQTVHVDEFADAFLRCLNESPGAAAAGSSFFPLVNTTPAGFTAAPAVHHPPSPPTPVSHPSGSSTLRRILEAPPQSSRSAGLQQCDTDAAASDVRSRHQSGSDLPTDIPSTTSNEPVLLNGKRSDEAEEASLDEYIRNEWIEAFTQEHAASFGGTDAFLALWPEYAGMEFAFMEKRDRYMELKSELEVRSNSTTFVDDSALKARLRSAKLDFRRAIRRIDRFAALVRWMPVQLRQMLDRKATFNEIFLRLSMPDEEASGLLRHVLFDPDEERICRGELRRETSAYFAKVLVEWPVDAVPVVEYRCLFHGCTFTSCWRKNNIGQYTDYLRLHLKNSHAFLPIAKRAGNKDVAAQPGQLRLDQTQLDAAVTAIILHFPIAPAAGMNPPIAAVVTTSDFDRMAAQSVVAPSFYDAGGDIAHVEDDDDIVFLEEVKTVGQGQVTATPDDSISRTHAKPPQFVDPLTADTAMTPPAPSSIAQSVAPTSPLASSCGEARTSGPQRKKPRAVAIPKRILSKPNCPAVMAAIPRNTPLSRKLRCDWPEYGDLSDDFNEKWKRYMGYLCEVDGMLSADGNCERAKQLEYYFRDYREAQARVEKFEALARKAPTDLRRFLAQKAPLEEIFHKLLEARVDPSNNIAKEEPADVVVLSDSDSDPPSA